MSVDAIIQSYHTKSQMLSKKFLIYLTIVLITILFIQYLSQSKFAELTTFVNKQNILAILVMSFLILIGLYNFVVTHGFQRSLTQIALWSGILLIIVAAYTFRFELQYASNRVLGALMPSYSWHNDQGQIVISRSNDGHFYINAIVNDVKIRFMVDTGASDVALTKQDAANLKFNLSKLHYTRQYSTANGVSFAAPVILNKFMIGNYIFKDVRAHIGQGGLDTSLLGMSLIERFTNFRIDNDLLIITIGNNK